MKLSEIRAVVTGGASGLGNAVATKLVAAGQTAIGGETVLAELPGASAGQPLA